MRREAPEVKKDMPILEMRPLDASLEEVFLTLTADNAAEQSTGEEKEEA